MDPSSKAHGRERGRQSDARACDRLRRRPRLPVPPPPVFLLEPEFQPCSHRNLGVLQPLPAPQVTGVTRRAGAIYSARTARQFMLPP